MLIISNVSCQHFQSRKSAQLLNSIVLQYSNHNYRIILEKDLEQLEALFNSPLLPHLRIHYLDVIKRAETIDVSQYNCTPYQLACVYPDDPTIYLNQLFFRQPAILRLSTLLHEIWHVESGKGHDEISTDFKLYGCSSPYQLERIFIQDIYHYQGFGTVFADSGTKNHILRVLSQKIAEDLKLNNNI